MNEVELKSPAGRRSVWAVSVVVIPVVAIAVSQFGYTRTATESDSLSEIRRISAALDTQRRGVEQLESALAASPAVEFMEIQRVPEAPDAKAPTVSRSRPKVHQARLGSRRVSRSVALRDTVRTLLQSHNSAKAEALIRHVSTTGNHAIQTADLLESVSGTLSAGAVVDTDEAGLVGLQSGAGR